MSAVITFTTDFGPADGYVAAMKGVVLGINPEARLIDISHAVKPGNISQAAFVLKTACGFFPRRSIHVVVVDPGVGTDRRAVILRTPEADFVAPDNGVLSHVIRPYTSGMPVDGYQNLEGVEACTITESRFWRSPVSTTFHGRDIFAPVAAHLSLGTPVSAFGSPADSLAVLPVSGPRRMPDGALAGTILHVDNFGNLITDIESDDLTAETGDITVEVGGKVIRGLSLTYGAADGLLALIGSSGHLEIALKDGDAATFIGAKVGDEVTIRVVP
ncbi:MAG: SAM-dependent chlorinase/fluorinase [Dehalococcoidales bacterium]|nr:SAM-dependent chlorinase/fluorinase [Dehalococcoidales bacterium]